MEAIFEFGGNLYEVVVIKFEIFLEFISGSDVDCPISHAEVEYASFVEIVLDAEGL